MFIKYKEKDINMSEYLDMLITEGIHYRYPKKDFAKQAFGKVVDIISRTKNNITVTPDYIVRNAFKQIEKKAHDAYLQGLHISPDVARTALTLDSLYNLIHKTEVDKSRNFNDRISSNGTTHSMSFSESNYGKELSISSGNITLTATASKKRDLLIESLYGDGRAHTITSGCSTNDMQITGEELITTPTIRVSTPDFRYKGIVPPTTEYQGIRCTKEEFKKHLRRMLFDACAVHLLFSEPDRYAMTNPINFSTSALKSQYQGAPDRT